MMRSAHTPADVQRLHEEFAALSGRREHIRFHERAWDHLLAEYYEGDVDRMAGDLRLIVRYLRKQIVAQKRNPGCLKLLNFLQPDRWDADVNEARVMFPAAAAPKRAPVAETAPSPEPDRDPSLSRGLEDLRRNLAGGPR